MYTTPRTLVSGRIPEFLENLKVEFESLAHDVNMYKMQRDEYERKLQSQLGELNNIQQTLFDLERNHSKIKSQYEDEIIRLRRQIDLHTSGQPGTATSGLQGGPLTGGSSGSVNSNFPTGRSVSPIPNIGNSTGTPSIIGGSLSGSGGSAQQSQQNAPTGSGPGSFNLAPTLRETSRIPPNSTENKGLAPIDKQRAYSSNSSTPLHQNSNIKRSRDGEKEHDEDKHKDRKFMSEGEKNRRDSASKGTIDNEESGVDWRIGYNPGVQTNLNVDLCHNLEHQSVVCCVKFSNDGKHLATGCNKSAQIFDSETGEKVHVFSDESGKDGDLYIRSVCFSPDNRLLAAGAEDKTVKIWNIESKRMHHTFIGHELDIYSLDFSEKGNFIVSGSGDKKAKIWDVEKGECLFTLGNEEVGPKDGVTSVAFSPDGNLVAAGSLDHIVRLWDARTGYFLERYEGHTDAVYSVAFSPDGKSLASGSLDKTLKLWDLAGTSRSRSRCRSTFSGHKDFVLSVAFSPDGNWLISGSKDRSVQFWDPRSAVTHMMLQGHKNSVISVAVSPSGTQFATGSGDFRARIWKYE